MNTNTSIRKTKAELINIINSQNEEINNLSAKIDSITANAVKNNMLREKINALAKKYQEKEIEFNKIKKDYDNNIDKQNRELQKTIIKYNSEIREKDIKYNVLIDTHKQLSAENEELKLKQKEYETTIKDLSNNINKLKTENNDLFIENENKDELINAMNTTIDNNNLQITVLQEDLNNKKSLHKADGIIYIICMIIVTLLGIFVF